VEAEQLLRGKGKRAGTGGKKLTEEREPREKEREGEREKELYQTVQINLDLKGMGLSSPLFLKPRTKNDGDPKKINLGPKLVVKKTKTN